MRLLGLQLRRVLGRSLGPGFALTLLLSSAQARAQELDSTSQLPELATEPAAKAPRSTTYDYSSYENETIENVAKQLGAPVDPSPEGKTIERIEIVPLDVIEPRDPVPSFLNIFHVTSRKRVIAREVLVRVGQPYSKVLVDETARNLRTIPQLSVVLCYAIRGRDPNKVVLVVVTKDIWSLRLNWEAAYTNGGLESLILQPSEENLLGSHQSVSGRFELQPESMSFGGSYTIPRMTSERIQATASGNVITNRKSGDPEGSFGGLSLTRPLWTTRSKWAWSTSTSWVNQISRRYVNAKVAEFDARVTPESDHIPWEYRANRWIHTTSVTRSFGWAIKNDFTLGAQYDRRHYNTLDLGAYDQDAVQEFQRRRLPHSDTRLGPFFQYRGYSTDYIRVLDFETLALQEDYRLGHDVILRLYPVSKALGSSRSFVGAFAAAQYTVPLSDGLARLGAESVTEAESDKLTDASINGFLRIITPRLGFGRLLMDADLLHRYRNYLNRASYLGGNGRLRGYPSNYQVGANTVSYNLEFRTRPINVLSCQVGGAAFYDVGDAFDTFEEMHLRQSVGVGVRALFPQLDRLVFRADLGMPVESGPLPEGVAPMTFYIAFGQAFGMPAITPP